MGGAREARARILIVLFDHPLFLEHFVTKFLTKFSRSGLDEKPINLTVYSSFLRFVCSIKMTDHCEFIVILGGVFPASADGVLRMNSFYPVPRACL